MLHSPLWADDDLGHHSAEILGVVAQAIEIGRVDEVGAGGDRGGVEDRVDAFAAAERDRSRRIGSVGAGRTLEELRALADDAHWNPQHRHGIELDRREATEPEQHAIALVY